MTCTPDCTKLVGALEQVLFHAAFVEVGNEHKDGVARIADQRLAVAHRAVDVRAAAELDAEQEIDGIVKLLGHVHHGGVEHDEMGFHGGHGGHDRAEDAGVDDRRRHRAALVDAEDDFPLDALRFAAIADQRFRNDGFVFLLPMFEVRPDRTVPVDLGMAGGAGCAQPGSARR